MEFWLVSKIHLASRSRMLWMTDYSAGSHLQSERCNEHSTLHLSDSIWPLNFVIRTVIASVRFSNVKKTTDTGTPSPKWKRMFFFILAVAKPVRHEQSEQAPRALLWRRDGLLHMGKARWRDGESRDLRARQSAELEIGMGCYRNDGCSPRIAPLRDRRPCSHLLTWTGTREKR